MGKEAVAEAKAEATSAVTLPCREKADELRRTLFLVRCRDIESGREEIALSSSSTSLAGHEEEEEEEEEESQGFVAVLR